MVVKELILLSRLILFYFIEKTEKIIYSENESSVRRKFTFR